jgi:osmoprotectant transport system ATP-binding protein
MIQLQQVCKRFGTSEVVRDVTFQVEEGELLMLLGGSGSGKTTTLKMINRLIEPSTGRILMAGKDTRELQPHELRRQIGYVFQKVGLFPHLTVGENIAITPSLLGWSSQRIAARVQSLLDLVELPQSMRSRAPHELSGGQAQRVGVARALAAEPRVMLLDEPFAALDPLTRERLQQNLLQIKEQLRLTVIFVSHDISEALLLGDRLAVMHEGRLLQIGTARQLQQQPASPYIQELLQTPQRHLAQLQRALFGSQVQESSPPKSPCR